MLNHWTKDEKELWRRAVTAVPGRALDEAMAYADTLVAAVRARCKVSRGPKEPPPPVPKELADLPLYAADENLCRIWPEWYAAALKAYPDLCVLSEVRRAHVWELAKPPALRKKQRGDFLVRWLNRADGQRKPDEEPEYTMTEAEMKACWDREDRLAAEGKI